ncbi:MAG: helix-turn-helix transcriptional regulator [Solirubrobacterales bacterium]|nr:helix-turn-helix transcriptional regulator [Solirubrobacterales bacterium]
MSQHDLAELAGVTASAISQAQRAERGLSLSTLAQLSLALGITIDDLLHGEGPDAYRTGRRPDDMQHREGHTATLLGGADPDLLVELVHLGPRQAAKPVQPPDGGRDRRGGHWPRPGAGRRTDAGDQIRRGAGVEGGANRSVAQHRPDRSDAVLDRRAGLAALSRRGERRGGLSRRHARRSGRVSR